MLLLLVLQLLLVTLSTVDNLGSLAPLIISIISIAAPAVSFVMNIVNAFKWMGRVLSVLYARTKALGTFVCEWARFAVIQLSMLTVIPRSLCTKGGDLLLEDSTLPASLEISPYFGKYADEGRSHGSHPAFLFPTSAFGALALFSLLSSIVNGRDIMHLPVTPESSLFQGIRRHAFYTRNLFPFLRCSWWTGVILSIGFLCTLIAALCPYAGTWRRWLIPKGKPQSSWANPPTSPPSSFTFDCITPCDTQLRTPPSQSALFLEENSLEAVATNTTPVVLTGNNLMETSVEASVNQAKEASETLADVGQTNAFAQVLILLAMVLVMMENEVVDAPVQQIVAAPKTEETFEQTIVVKPELLNWNGNISSESPHLLSMTASTKNASHKEENWEQTFGSFEEDIRSFSPMFGMPTQESKTAQPLEHFVSANHDSIPDLIVTNEQGEISASDIDGVLKEFSSMIDAASDGSTGISELNGGEGRPSSDLVNTTPHSECFPLREDVNKQTFALCPPQNFEQWLDLPQGDIGNLVSSPPVAQEYDNQVIEGFDEFLRQLSSSANIVAEGCGTDPAVSNELISQHLPSSLDQIPDFGEAVVPATKHEKEEVPDFSSWFESPQNQKFLDDIAADFSFSLDGPDPNLEAALAALEAASCVPPNDNHLQQWLDSLPEPVADLENVASAVHNANWSLELPVAQPELSFTPPSNVGFDDNGHFTTDELFVPKSTVIRVSLPRSAAPVDVRVNPDAGHSTPAATEGLVQVDTTFADLDVSSSTLVVLDEEIEADVTKTVSEDSASGARTIFHSCAPAPVVDLHEEGVVSGSDPIKPPIDFGPSFSAHTPRYASDNVPIVDASAVLRKEQTCHYVIAGVETYEEVKAKFDLYDLFAALATQSGEVQGVSASMHAVKQLVPENIRPVDTASSTVKRERNGRICSDVLSTPIDRERPIPVPRKSEPVRLPAAFAITPNPASAPPASPLKERETPKNGGIYTSMWAKCPEESAPPQTVPLPRMHASPPRASKAPRLEGPKRLKDGGSNASIWASYPMERKTPRSTTTKYADTFPLNMSKSTRDCSTYSSVYADRPEPQKPVPPKPKSSFEFASTRVDGHGSKNTTSGWTREDFEGARILLGFSSCR